MQYLKAPSDSDREQVELSISCKDLKKYSVLFKKCNPQVRVYIKNATNMWVFFDETEILFDNLNPNFKRAFQMDFIFETHQHIKFEIVDTDGLNSAEVLGHVETTIGAIMGARKQTFTAELKTPEKMNGQLIVRGEKVESNCQSISWEWSYTNLKNIDGWFGGVNPFIKFHKIRRIRGDFLQVHETEVLTTSGQTAWKPFKIVDKRLCSDYHQDFLVECWNHKKNGKHQLIGFFEASFFKIKTGVTKYELYNSKLKQKAGILEVNDFCINPNITFVDYLRGGTQLSVFIAIDFTSSNKDPWDAEYLHHKGKKHSNPYSEAISAICPIVLNYDFDQLVSIFGFGGKPLWREPSQMTEYAADEDNPVGIFCAPGINRLCWWSFPEEITTSHCFPLAKDEGSEEVEGTQGILKTYWKSLDQIKLSGPRKFAPVIKRACERGIYEKDCQSVAYTILVILTDGEATDMNETVEELVKAAELPVSIIIVGVGDSKFEKMKKLDANHFGLRSAKGKMAKRDLVQFVPFKEYKNDPELLAKQVLAEIPGQLVEYMEMIGRKPGFPLKM